MYANLHTIIFTFTLIFLKITCKQTAKKGKPYQLSPNHEEHQKPFIHTDFKQNNTLHSGLFISKSVLLRISPRQL